MGFLAKVLIWVSRTLYGTTDLRWSKLGLLSILLVGTLAVRLFILSRGQSPDDPVRYSEYLKEFVVHPNLSMYYSGFLLLSIPLVPFADFLTAVMLAAVTVTSAATILVYLIGEKLGGSIAALSSAVIYALSASQLILLRRGLYPNAVVMFFLLLLLHSFL